MTKSEFDNLIVGDMVIMPIKNRWGLECAATIEAIHSQSFDATVWNMDGPGSDRLVTNIPFEVATIDRSKI